MATRIHRTVVDDLDASTDGVGTYRFALEGVEYEIDLSQANLQRLRAALAPFTSAGRRLPKHQPATRRTSHSTWPTATTPPACPTGGPSSPNSNRHSPPV